MTIKSVRIFRKVRFTFSVRNKIKKSNIFFNVIIERENVQPKPLCVIDSLAIADKNKIIIKKNRYKDTHFSFINIDTDCIIMYN